MKYRLHFFMLWIISLASTIKSQENGISKIQETQIEIASDMKKLSIFCKAITNPDSLQPSSLKEYERLFSSKEKQDLSKLATLHENLRKPTQFNDPESRGIKPFDGLTTEEAYQKLIDTSAALFEQAGVTASIKNLEEEFFKKKAQCTAKLQEELAPLHATFSEKLTDILTIFKKIKELKKNFSQEIMAIQKSYEESHKERTETLKKIKAEYNELNSTTTRLITYNELLAKKQSKIDDIIYIINQLIIKIENSFSRIKALTSIDAPEINEFIDQ